MTLASTSRSRRVHRRRGRRPRAAGLLPPGPRRRRARDLRCEKQQVAALAEYLAGVIADLGPRPTASLPAICELSEPFEEGWTVGTIGVAYDEPDDRIVVVVEELIDEDERTRGRRCGCG